MMGLMRNTIKYHEDFITPRDFPYELMELFTIRTKLAKFPDDPRYGLVVTKRNFRYAVQRNRVKRLLRDWIAFNEKYMCPDLDYVFYVSDDYQYLYPYFVLKYKNKNGDVLFYDMPLVDFFE